VTSGYRLTRKQKVLSHVCRVQATEVLSALWKEVRRPDGCKTYRRVRSLTVVAPGGPTRIQHMGASAITCPVDRSRDPRARKLLRAELR
jgi:hypothetical protein